MATGSLFEIWGNVELSDDAPQFHDDVDHTKKVRVECSEISTNTTRRLYFGDDDIDFRNPLDGYTIVYDAANRKWEPAAQSGGGGGASYFLGLTDTPSSYAGHTGKVPKVKGTEDGLEFDAIVGLAPAGGASGYVLKKASAADYDFVWALDEGGSGATEFIGLNDTPAGYTGAGDKVVKVNSGATALEFVAQGAGGGLNADQLDGQEAAAFAAASHNHDGEALNMQDQELTRPILKDYCEVQSTPSISSGTLDLYFTQGNVAKVTLDQNITTINISNPPPAGKSGTILIKFVQDATGGRTVAGWPGTVSWYSGSAPVIRTDGNAATFVSLLTDDGGTSYIGLTVEGAAVVGGQAERLSAVPDGSGQVFPDVLVGATNGRRIEGLGVTDASTLSADRTWFLTFQPPSPLPTGTPKLRIWSRSLGTGNVIVNPKWASVADGENPDTIALNAEGNNTITLSSTVFEKIDIALDADTIVAGEVIVMDLVFVDIGTTATQRSVHIPSIIWE